MMNTKKQTMGYTTLAARVTAFAIAVGGLSFGAFAQTEKDLMRLDSIVTDVTVYGDSAIITRRAEMPVSEGYFRLSGLPSAMDPASLRVRTSGGEVVGVDTRLRYAKAVTGVRITELEAALESALRTAARLEDEDMTASSVAAYFDRLLVKERGLFERGLARGEADVQRWEDGMTFFEEELKRVRKESRAISWLLADADRAVVAARTELSGARTPSGDYTYDLEIDVVSNGSATELEVEYLVHRAGWTPLYDLRAAQDMKSVELVYRAKVQQNTGEDWEDVSLLLSTAQPELGARGPELEVTWAGLYDPSNRMREEQGVAASMDGFASELKSLGYLDEAMEQEDSWAPSFAGVIDSGLSVRFQLPRTETVESREEPSTLLLGRADLAVDVEHYAVPALSERVWLRGHAENTSPWAMLPGEASVYFGDDFIGHSVVGRVMVGEKFDLHLGADPGLSLERTLVEDLSKGPSFFRSSQSVTESWRVHITNHGSTAAAADGSVDVIVQEVLPSSTDERLVIELDTSTPRVSEDERWKRDREERGILTWILHVSKGGNADLKWTRKVTYPKGLRVTGGN